MPYVVERHKHTISSWVATINCEGSAFAQMLRDVPEHSRVAHTQAKMMEIVRARARRIADNSGDKSYRSVHEIREEQIMLGEILVEQIAADVCHALLNLQADPWKSKPQAKLGHTDQYQQKGGRKAKLSGIEFGWFKDRRQAR
ncbi:MAG: hypothetical protein V3V10_08295 [Planctomycetota bacterium]